MEYDKTRRSTVDLDGALHNLELFDIVRRNSTELGKSRGARHSLDELDGIGGAKKSSEELNEAL